MTLPKYALKYEDYDVKDLREFIVARTYLSLKNKKTSANVKKMDKETCAATLRELDGGSRFRFLDLAPELRVLIYKELLSHDRRKERSAFPSILRVSKLVHHEAVDVLNTESIVSLTVDTDVYTFEEDGTGDRDFGYVHVMGDLSFNFSRAASRSSYMPKLSSLDNIIKLHLLLDLDETQQGHSIPDEDRWNFFVDFMDGLVASCKSLKEITIVKSPSPGMYGQFDSEFIPLLLEPLRYLPQGCEVTIEGLEERIHEETWRLISEVADTEVSGSDQGQKPIYED